MLSIQIAMMFGTAMMLGVAVLSEQLSTGLAAAIDEYRRLLIRLIENNETDRLDLSEVMPVAMRAGYGAKDLARHLQTSAESKRAADARAGVGDEQARVNALAEQARLLEAQIADAYTTFEKLSRELQPKVNSLKNQAALIMRRRFDDQRRSEVILKENVAKVPGEQVPDSPWNPSLNNDWTDWRNFKLD